MRPYRPSFLLSLFLAAQLLLNTHLAHAVGELVSTFELEAGQSPNPAPGDGVVFVVTMKNVGDEALESVKYIDQIDACFEPYGKSDDPCDVPAVVSCTGVGRPTCGACIYLPDGLLTYIGTIAANDGQPGGPDELSYRIVASAGSTLGVCEHDAVPCPVGACNALTVRVTITEPPPGCNLQYADVDLESLVPPRLGDWVFGHSCAQGNTLPAANVAVAGMTGDVHLEDPIGSTKDNLRVYDLSCDCAGRISLVKDSSVVPTRVRVQFF